MISFDKLLKAAALVSIAACALLTVSCGTMQTGGIAKENSAFLQKDPSAKEVFHVLISSDRYEVSQMKDEDTIRRAADKGGDKYISSELAKLDKINEVREGVISIWLYPDTGRLMKIRTQVPTYLIETDKLMTEDIQRWNFTFPKKVVQPTRLNIKYRVILQKKISDDQIIKEVQQKMSEEH